ncbi:pentatricopeptide repeat-containing protein At4g16470-like isoform X1 [Mercurialis annua]|uniref:pentatricopeptide repeat-containing protein At4g16470-like isoform X1 n=1 Tax=Mercurialis annua TaxID=3986 RepID=UPI00215E5BD3|nr:pentatricopeptide repeat-containing protein At4g16470-like isoform X1 [Mercurialis annua]
MLTTISKMKCVLLSLPFSPISLASKSKIFSNAKTFKNSISLPIATSTPMLSILPIQNRCLYSESDPSHSSGEIHVIVGPMFAGKTTTLLRRMQSESTDGSFQVENLLRFEKTLKGLCCSGRMTEAVALLWRTGFKVEHRIYALMLQECIFRKQYMMGMRIHAQMVVVGYVGNEYLKNKLLILYAKSGDLRTARVFFDSLLDKSLISWNAIIAGYVQKGLDEIGLSLYYRMRQNGLIPDQYTFASAFRACAALATLEHGKKAHCVMLKCYLRENVVVNSALIDMYFKCSNLVDGHKVFSKSSNRNVVTWTSLISGYGQHGRVTEVLDSFRRMKDDGFRPNYVTFLAVLSACSHGGLIDKGWDYFLSMERDYGIRPRGQHYAAMVDLLGRSGRLREAYKFVLDAPCKEHSVIWGALLGACRIHRDMHLLKLVAKKFFELNPENAGKYVVLSNAYATFGCWDAVAKVRVMMSDSGISKEPAYSMIEVQGEVYCFLMGDKSHQKFEEICRTIIRLNCILMDAAYIPDISNQ